MALIIVEHDTPAPALYGTMAAVVAADRGADLAHLPARFDRDAYPDAMQHPAASGVLVPSGLLWFERLTNRDVGGPATVAAMLHAAARTDVVVPIHPAVMPADPVAALRNGAMEAGIALEHLTVWNDQGRFALRRRGAEGSADPPGRWIRDAFGRPISAKQDGVGSPTPSCSSRREGEAEWRGTTNATLLRTDGARAADRSDALRIGLIGTERDHRDVYPGALAALGDAADAAGAPVHVVFIDPKAVRASDVPMLLASVDGILLPGGSDMANVPGQILMARAAFERAVPAVGLCLGMQTMTTALAQAVLGEAGVNLAEADPDAALQSFVPLSEDASLSPHRLGEHVTVPVAGTRYGDLPGVPRRERFNHRFRLNTHLARTLALGGARISAWDETGTVVDAIEIGRHPFFIGLQGHPELRSRPEAPHPVLSAFVATVQTAAAFETATSASRAARSDGS